MLLKQLKQLKQPTHVTANARGGDVMQSKFRVAPQPGRPVEPPPGAGFAHVHVRPDGSRVVVLRDHKGRLLPGNRLCDLRVDDLGGAEARNPVSVARAALGLPSRWTERRKRKEGEK
jgi:hypothetical protein